jgi:hypothetical protein
MLQGMQENFCLWNAADRILSAWCDEIPPYSFQGMQGGCSRMFASVRYSPFSNSCIAIINVVLC